MWAIGELMAPAFNRNRTGLGWPVLFISPHSATTAVLFVRLYLMVQCINSKFSKPWSRYSR